MSLNLDLWHLIRSVVFCVSGIPQWLLELAGGPLEDVKALPDLDHAGDGQVAHPYCETKRVTSDYLAFLLRQIESRDRGPEWTELLRARYDALKPYEERHVINITFYRKPESVTLRLDGETKELIQVEII